MPLPAVRLVKGRESSIHRGHLWVFSGAVASSDAGIRDGDAVRVLSASGAFLGVGHFASGSIAIRLISREDRTPDAGFWREKLGQALDLRRRLGLVGRAETSAFRLVFGEGDALPGLVIDIYGTLAVFQPHSVGMNRSRDLILKALLSLPDLGLESVYAKPAPGSTPRDQPSTGEWISGEPRDTEITESGYRFQIRCADAQKTGFFLDQRENRSLLDRYSRGRTVLDTFCYSGGFSVHARGSGARLVHSVDSSSRAIKLVTENIALNPPSQACPHEAIESDVMEYLRGSQTRYDLIVLDPPAFAKNLRARHQAVQGYKRLNAMALNRLNPGGILFTFSCSQAVDRTLFLSTVTSAAIECNRPTRILHHLSQAPDHPINIFHPESEYLKGLVLTVE
jgi:23S rRNA (cytosine1962-C5)-methyltransferase